MPAIRRKAARVPSVLTVAGSDSGGGAGIQADLKTFAAIGVHGTSALTCITAQNPGEVRAVQPSEPKIVRDQIEAILAELPPAAIKTGMLFSTEIVEVVLDSLKTCAAPRVVDPVMISTSGARLLDPGAVALVKSRLLPMATIATPNLSEAEFLLSTRISNHENLRLAAREFYARFGCAALLKGGHLPGDQAIDFYYDGRIELMLEAPRIKGVSTHGTGCTYSAAIAAYCASGHTLEQAVIAAKTFISNAIAFSQKCARHFVLNSLWNRR